MNQISKIALITPQTRNPIKVRILSKGTIHRNPQDNHLDDHLELIVCDESGSIYVEVKGPYLSVIEEMIKPNVTYILNGYEVNYATSEGHWYRNHLELLITRPCHVFECKDVETPPMDTIAQLKGHLLLSCRERFYRTMSLMLVQVFPHNGTYLGCPDDNCRNAINEDAHHNGMFVCTRGCQQIWDRRVARYCLRVRFQDGTGILNAMCYDEGGFIFTRMNAAEFRNMALNDPHQMHRRVRNVINRMYDIRVQIKLEQLRPPLWRKLTFVIHDIHLA